MHDVTLLAYIVVVLVITLWPSPPDPGSVPLFLRLLDWAHGAGLPTTFDLVTAEVVANVVMFVPLGLLLATSARVPRAWLAVAAGLALSAAIETTQIALPDRYPTVQDVVANTAGAALGAAAVVARRTLARRARRTSPGRPLMAPRPPAD